MKRKNILAIAAAASCLIVAAAAPGDAKPAAKFQYPKWYYYDQLGLQLWNKGEKKKAVEQFKFAKRMCETSTRIPPGGLDTKTKGIITDLIHHNMLVLVVEDEEPIKAGNISDPNLRLTAEVEERNRQLDKKIQFIQDMKKFVQRFIGQKVHLAVDMDQRVNGIHILQAQNNDYLFRVTHGLRGFANSPVSDADRVTDNKGVAIPKWFRSNSSRFGDAGQEKERPPGAQYERGVSYKGGQRYEPHRQNSEANGGWGGNMGQTDNPALKSQGWGSGETSGPQKLKNLWGQEREEIDINKKRPPKAWGETNTPKETAGSGWGSGSNWGEPVQEGQSPNSTPGSTSQATGQ